MHPMVSSVSRRLLQAASGIRAAAADSATCQLQQRAAAGGPGAAPRRPRIILPQEPVMMTAEEVEARQRGNYMILGALVAMAGGVYYLFVQKFKEDNPFKQKEEGIVTVSSSSDGAAK